MRYSSLELPRRCIAADHPGGLSHPSRRSFLGRSVAALAVEARIGPDASGRTTEPPRPTKVIDCHAHLQHHSRSTWEADDRKLIAAADRLGIDLLCCSLLTLRRPATAEQFRECNRRVVEAMKRF